MKKVEIELGTSSGDTEWYRDGKSVLGWIDCRLCRLIKPNRDRSIRSKR